jgi:hypothetical protein
VADLDDLLAQLAAGLVEGAERGLPLQTRLCASAARLLGCDGAAITVAYTRPERVTVATTDETALILEEAQDVTGQGPGVDAFTTGAYSRLELPEDGRPDPRWPLLHLESVPDLAPVVVHAIPLTRADRVIGVLTLYRRGTDTDLDDSAATVVSKAVAAALVADGPDERSAIEGPWAERAEVHQATGMVVAQLGIPEEDALALLRAHAYSHEQSVGSTARDVITKRLRFSASPDQEIEST